MKNRPGWRRAAILAAATALALPLWVRAQEKAVSDSHVTLSADEASLEVRMADGATHAFTLAGGEVRVDGEVLGTYEPGGALWTSWRTFLPEVVGSATPGRMLEAWEPELPTGADGRAARALTATFDELFGAVPEAAARTAPTVGGQVLAPGGMSFDQLTVELERLGDAVARLGDEAQDAVDHLALVVHDDYAVPEGTDVAGNVALLDGDLELRGTVEGDVLVLSGTLDLAPGGLVEGDIIQVGGEVVRSGGHVDGELLSLRALPAPEAPAGAGEAAAPPSARVDGDVGSPSLHLQTRRGFFGRVGHNISRAVGSLVGTLGFLIVLGFLGMLAVYFLRSRLEVVADTVRQSFGRSFGVGIAGQLLFVPILIVLFVAVITIPIVPFYVIAVALALLGGYLAVAHAAGEIVALQRYTWIERLRLRRSNSYYYVLSGLVVLLGPLLVGSLLYLFGGLLGFVRGLTFFAGGVLTWAAFTSGFGAVILSRAGKRTEWARPASGVGDLFAEADEYGGGASSA
ncbi:MAG: hypothetical protein ACE5HF_01575 [Gemmatimonadota bacterium]